MRQLYACPAVQHCCQACSRACLTWHRHRAGDSARPATRIISILKNVPQTIVIVSSTSIDADAETAVQIAPQARVHRHVLQVSLSAPCGGQASRLSEGDLPQPCLLPLRLHAACFEAGQCQHSSPAALRHAERPPCSKRAAARSARAQRDSRCCHDPQPCLLTQMLSQVPCLQGSSWKVVAHQMCQLCCEALGQNCCGHCSLREPEKLQVPVPMLLSCHAAEWPR